MVEPRPARKSGGAGSSKGPPNDFAGNYEQYMAESLDKLLETMSCTGGRW